MPGEPADRGLAIALAARPLRRAPRVRAGPTGVMSGPLDVWFDDLVVDTVPVGCHP
ncbi:MAG: hypothetical protein H0V17_23245 [Deltaproteobacteria bacterium]|nr:hypothetical protein [Deltaproteobacteria bacterium]